MFIHQVHNSIGDDIYNAYVYSDIEWLTHLHKGFELTMVLDGEIEAEAGGKRYRLGAGDCLLLTPYQLHSYKTPKHSTAFVVVFSGSYVETFARLTKGKEAENARIVPSEQTREIFIKGMLYGKTMPQDLLFPPEKLIPVDKPPLLVLKACLYAICAEFYAATEFADRPRDNTLIFEILAYVENHYTADISLYSMADTLGYDYRYLSRLFGKTFGISFKTLVNQYRCDHAKNLIFSTDDTLSEIAMNSGFQSIRSFNRVFRELTGEQPSELRNNRKLSSRDALNPLTNHGKNSKLL